MMRIRVCLLTVSSLAYYQNAATEEPLFPFVVSYGTPDNVTNVSAWLDKPAGQNGFVRVDQGHLATNRGPIRFWATNFCFEACFPSHEQAERVAARLARLGINCVRLHHMDSRSIWGDSPNKLTIDPKKLEQLDYLIHQLKQHGVYVNINLHVSRTLGEKEGFINPAGRPNYDKGLDNFEPRMIEAQQKYARDLLTHVNPYTKTAYTHEPAVAFVEINNENGLYSSWTWGHLDELPEPYATTWRQLWNDWLEKKYGTTARLASAWNVGATALGAELLTNGDFRQPLDKTWHLERDEQTEAQWLVEPDDAGKRKLRVVVVKQGQVAWHPQFHHAGLNVRRKSPYTLTFRARSEKPQKVTVNCMMAGSPWQQLGFSASAALGPKWKDYRFTFMVSRDERNARITFSSLPPGTYEFADVSLRLGGIVGLEAGQKLEDASVPPLRHGQLSVTETARADFSDFLIQTEKAYWSGMYRFLKEELHVQSLVAGTQLNYGPLHVQAGLDYIDAHSYWHHPAFPGRPWDPQNWYVHNAALVNSPGGTLAGLAVRRVAGMAFTVSEYNHPAPISYAAEGFPMLAAFGAFQGWDAVYSFAYNHNADFEPLHVSSFFDIKGDPTRLVHSAACAALFLRGAVTPARQMIRVPISRQAERDKLRETLDPWSITAERFGLDGRHSLLHAVAVDAEGGDAKLPERLAAETTDFASDTSQLRWNVAEKEGGYFTADTPQVKLFTGFVRRRTFELGNVMLQIGSTRLDWATVSIVACDAQRLDLPGRLLLAATGWMQNEGQELEKLGDDRVTLRNRWGKAPVLCEGIHADVRLPLASSRVKLFPLDESGNRGGEVACRAADGQTTLPLRPEHKTLWYEVEIR